MLKHKIAGGLLAAALTLGAAGAVIIPANAAEIDGSATVSCDASWSDNGVSTYSVSYPYGGTWQYGTTLPLGCGEVYSNFLHNSRKHHSSVMNANGIYAYSGVKGAGVWAEARTTAVCGKVDQSFYGFDD